MQADSIAVLKVYTLTEIGSQMLQVSMLSIFPVFPLIPKTFPSGPALCLARSSVTTLTTSAPQLVASVRGMTSKALARAL
jgi:hypothetical protein